MRNPFARSSHNDDSAPSEIYGYRVYMVALSATWASAMYGYDSAFIGGTLELPAFKKSFGLDRDNANSFSSNVVSMFQAEAFFGAIFGFFFAEYLGRKPVILGSGVIFAIESALQLIGHIAELYAGRVLTGLGVGASSTTIPVYIAECSPALIRGRLVGIFEVMLQVALVFGFWVNYGVEKNIPSTTAAQWRIPVGVQLIPAGMLLFCMSWMIESPRWLASKNKTAKAQTNLAWVRSLPVDHPYVVNEMAEIQAAVNQELEMSGERRTLSHIVRECGAPGVRNRILIGVMLMLLQNLTEINSINYYSPTIFRPIGFTGTSVGLLATGVYGLVKMGTTVVFMIWIVDCLGRRDPLLVGAMGAAVAIFYLAIYSQVSQSFDHVPPSDAGSRTAVAMVYIYAIFYGFSWNGIPWIFASEVLPTRVRTIGMIKHGTFYFFGACTIVAFLFAYLFVPETKGILLEDMGALFGADVTVFANKARTNYLEFRQAQTDAGDEARLEKQDNLHVENV
ncbi:sugar transporter [Penicillium malachiteum]|uniref:Quinate transporter n=1 Tax=Penicillium malachiteum TaxID=1324776 RepID=A0AAD6MXG7_9EURO|nr:sugar transporter [Penicillium malachiteum]